MSQALAELLTIETSAELDYGYVGGGGVYHLELRAHTAPDASIGRALCGVWLDSVQNGPVPGDIIPHLCKRCRYVAHDRGLPYGLIRPQRKKSRRPRDAQRQRLYNAEREVFSWKDEDGDLDGSVEAAQAFVDRVQNSSWFKRMEVEGGSRWVPWNASRDRLIVSSTYKGSRWSRAGGRVVKYRGRWHPVLSIVKGHRVHSWVLLHEMCHWLAPDHARHNAAYARIYLSGVERFFGKVKARELRVSYKKHRVKYRAKGSR